MATWTNIRFFHVLFPSYISNFYKNKKIVKTATMKQAVSNRGKKDKRFELYVNIIQISNITITK